MTPGIRLFINCIVVAGATFGAIMLVTVLPVMDWSPFRWGNEVLDTSLRLAAGAVYRIIIWVIAGSLVAWLMLRLEPRKVILYSLVSAVTFVVTMRSWQVLVSGDSHHVAQELIWILTVPCLFWIFARHAERRRANPIRRTDRQNSGDQNP